MENGEIHVGLLAEWGDSGIGGGKNEANSTSGVGSCRESLKQSGWEYSTQGSNKGNAGTPGAPGICSELNLWK